MELHSVKQLRALTEGKIVKHTVKKTVPGTKSRRMKANLPVSSSIFQGRCRIQICFPEIPCFKISCKWTNRYHFLEKKVARLSNPQEETGWLTLPLYTKTIAEFWFLLLNLSMQCSSNHINNLKNLPIFLP